MKFGTQPPVANILTRGAGDKLPHPFTVVMMGTQRSGTSATACMLHHMGIAMDGSGDGHFERFMFKNGFEGYHEDMKQRIQELNQAHRFWGTQIWQREDHLEWMCQHVRNPVLVIPFRDPVAILTRWNSIDFQEEILRGALVEQFFCRLWHIFWGCTCPAIAVSFERLKADPGKTHDEIAAFLRLAGNRAEAVASINKGSGYLIQDQ